MDVKGITGALGKSSASLGELAQGKLHEWLNEYKNATELMATFGFSVGKFGVSMALIPEVHTSFVGAVADIHVDKLEQMATARPDDKLFGHLVKALVMTRRFHDHVDLKLEKVTLNVTLGLPPKVDVETS